ncbi:MAG TPA: plasmid pRiA4b ORF-3 family protein [Thermoplasmatales archaeon]|nr:plasmid pRiA4b ORF-3 family protein [Thermoplasmatales archaeon]
MNKDLGIGIKSKILQLKISLDGINPEIWRRFLVKDNISFENLHNIIQIVMGWENYHLYEFEIDEKFIEADEDRFFVDAVWKNFMPRRKTLPARETELKELIKSEKQKFHYLYDFGDSWLHTIIVEKIFDEDVSKRYPICLDGERACPPEDCGGVGGYLELLEIKENKNHPEYEERIVEWLGEDFDPEYFDINEVNKWLKKLRL